MAMINVTLRGLPEVTERLKSIQGGAAWALRMAILKALTQGKTAATRFIRERYNAPFTAVRAAISTPRLVGLSGIMRASGAKLPLSMFPFTDQWPRGVEVRELRSGPAIVLRHAFANNVHKQVYERRDREKRGGFPNLMRMVGLSIPQMLGEKKTTFPKLKEKLDTDVHLELERLTRLILSGSIKPR
jgi:hypothetical protein